MCDIKFRVKKILKKKKKKNRVKKIINLERTCPKRTNGVDMIGRNDHYLFDERKLPFYFEFVDIHSFLDRLCIKFRRLFLVIKRSNPESCYHIKVASVPKPKMLF